MIELKIFQRLNREGRPCISPFIEGYNVWDIPVKQWTPAVQKAIISAYGLGIKHSMTKAEEKMRSILYSIPDTNREWRED